MSFNRSISVVSLLFTSLSCMIGSGWLFGSYYAATIAGPDAIFSWMLGGGLIVFIALTFSELSTMLPVTGGLARFTQFSHGTLVSFCISWLAWLSCVAVAPTEVQAILQYSTRYWPWLTQLVDGAHVLTGSGLGVASVLLLLITWLNILGVKTLTRYNNAITLWKIGVPMLTLLVLVTTRFSVDNFSVVSYTSNAERWHHIFWALPTAGIVFSFLGFREATSLAGEAKRPQVAIPLAVIGSVVICTLLYVALEIAFVGSVSPSALVNGWSHLHFSGDAGPFAGIALTLGLGWLVTLIYVDALVSPFGTALIYTATTARLNYAMSKNRYTPLALLKLNKKGVPVTAVLFNFIVGLLLFMPFPGWQALVTFQSLAIVLAYGVGPISLLALRRQMPNLKRPFRLPGVYLLSAFTFYICNMISYWAGWEIIWRLMISLILGIMILFAYRFWSHHLAKNSKNIEINLREAWWLIPYFLGLAAISYIGNFKGKGWLPFGWNFVLIALFSLVILVLAYQSRLPANAACAQIPTEL